MQGRDAERPLRRPRPGHRRPTDLTNGLKVDGTHASGRASTARPGWVVITIGPSGNFGAAGYANLTAECDFLAADGSGAVQRIVQTHTAKVKLGHRGPLHERGRPEGAVRQQRRRQRLHHQPRIPRPVTATFVVTDSPSLDDALRNAAVADTTHTLFGPGGSVVHGSVGWC